LAAKVISIPSACQDPIKVSVFVDVVSLSHPAIFVITNPPITISGTFQNVFYFSCTYPDTSTEGPFSSKNPGTIVFWVRTRNFVISTTFFLLASSKTEKSCCKVSAISLSVYGVNKVWLKTGQGAMFSDKKIDTGLEKMTVLFNQLNPHFKRYVLTQIKQLIKLQNIRDMG
jgi:hypothetical protein